MYDGIEDRGEDRYAENIFISHNHGWDIFLLWEKYQDMAVHFDDLCMKIRVQSLAFLSGLLFLFSVFGELVDSEGNVAWGFIAVVFIFLTFFWSAIFVIDIMYYNRLLLSSVSAIIELERRSKVSSFAPSVNFSSVVSEQLSKKDYCRRKVPGELAAQLRKKFPTEGNVIRDIVVSRTRARRWFYIIVFFPLVGTLVFSVFCFFWPTICFC